jgi:hypothetical protein
VGVLVGVAKTGVNQSPFGLGQIGTRPSSHHDTMDTETTHTKDTVPVDVDASENP